MTSSSLKRHKSNTSILPSLQRSAASEFSSFASETPIIQFVRDTASAIVILPSPFASPLTNSGTTSSVGFSVVTVVVSTIVAVVVVVVSVVVVVAVVVSTVVVCGISSSITSNFLLYFSAYACAVEPAYPQISAFAGNTNSLSAITQSGLIMYTFSRLSHPLNA